MIHMIMYRLQISKEYIVHVDEYKSSCLTLHHLLYSQNIIKKAFPKNHSFKYEITPTITYFATILDGK